MKLLNTLAALLTLSASSAANTWVVDDDGGPGVDFLHVSAAIAAASPGDKIFVHPGIYFGVVSTDKGLTLVGVGAGVYLAGDYYWHDVPAHQELRVVGIRINKLHLSDCSGAVLIDALSQTFEQLTATNCTDVRVRGGSFTSFGGGVNVVADASRLELVGCSITGVAGYDGNLVSGGGQGGDALHVKNGATVTANACVIRGGRGGDTISVLGDYGGDGGAGARIFPGGELTVTGTSAHTITGGRGGIGPNMGDDGYGGDGVVNDGVLRISGAVAVAGDSVDYIDGVPISGSGVLVTPVPDDPFMELDGPVIAGGPLRIVIHGEPGGVVRLLAGRSPVLVPSLTSPDLRLTLPFRSMWVGNLSASGFLEHDIVLPPGLNPGSRFVLQAKITTALGDRLTNSAPLLVR